VQVQYSDLGIQVCVFQFKYSYSGIQVQYSGQVLRFRQIQVMQVQYSGLAIQVV